MNRSAFTLLEVLVAAALIGLAATTVTLGMRGLSTKSRLLAAVSVIEDQMDRGRFLARTSGLPAWLEFDRDLSRLRVQNADRTTDWRSVGRVTIRSVVDRNGAEAQPIRINPVPLGRSWAVELAAGQRVLTLAFSSQQCSAAYLDTTISAVDWAAVDGGCR